MVAKYGPGRLNISLILVTQYAVQIFSIHAITFFKLFTGIKKRMAKSLLQLACDKLLKCARMTLEWR